METKNKGLIDTTPLWEDIIAVIKVTSRDRNVHVSAIFHTEKEDFPVMKVLLMENKRDYYKSTGEYLTLSVYMAMGDYVYRLLPFRDHLEISVKTTITYENGEEDIEEPPTEVRYKALISFTTNSFPSSESLSNREAREINNLPPVTVNMELQDRCEEPFRLKTIDGVYRKVTMEQMIRGALIHEANKVKVDGKPIIQVLEFDPPDNKEPTPDLIIPHGTYLRDLPGFLQEKAKGVYNAGIGSFFQRYRQLRTETKTVNGKQVKVPLFTEPKPTWFVFPLFKKERFDEDRVKLVIFAVPEDRIPTINRTFRIEGKTIYIAATGEKKMAENSKNPDLNVGTGFRMPDAEAYMLKPVKVLPKGIEAKRRQLNHEVADRTRKDQMDSGRMHVTSANTFMKYSEIQSRNYSGVGFLWDNSNPELLYPGMPVKYVYMDRGDYIEAKGILVTAYTVTKLMGNPTEGKGHGVATQMNILIEPQSVLPDNDKRKVGETE